MWPTRREWNPWPQPFQRTGREFLLVVSPPWLDSFGSTFQIQRPVLCNAQWPGGFSSSPNRGEPCGFLLVLPTHIVNIDAVLLQDCDGIFHTDRVRREIDDAAKTSSGRANVHRHTFVSRLKTRYMMSFQFI